MVTLYLIRHGQSEANSKGIIQGHAEFPLSELGKKQASLAGKWMADIQIDAIYTSDLQRAKATAESIAQFHPLKASEWKMIREVGLGPLEGKTRKEMGVEFPDLQRDALLTSGIEGTETVEAITERCKYVINQLSSAYQEKTVALVSHGGFISILLMYIIAGDHWATLKRPFVIGNTGITKVTIDEDGSTKLHYTNRTNHLEYDGLQSSTVLY
ncbi:histidine phosphatase family protein [Salipaludibacillus keqinensis]|uniref:Histidine phosphatase family protein n=1 Tax=Salipaludibacillus keqinensis TaxID=2045207 RepID=A0A323TC89_9BACI|nr:histidine phosphatase family protein [Salipaludibacillus keqinensis]PYZ92390.1 histidine phosphatase family protein [Salipaludibacillus keqinensis]